MGSRLDAVVEPSIHIAEEAAPEFYGSSEAQTQALRGRATGGKLYVEHGHEDSFLPRDARGIPITGFTDNWWTGLELMHTLFALEHNAIVITSRGTFPSGRATSSSTPPGWSTAR